MPDELHHQLDNYTEYNYFALSANLMRELKNIVITDFTRKMLLI